MIIDSPIISGSYSASGSLNQFGNVVITGSLTITGGITGSISGSAISASYASNAELLDGLDSTVFTLTSSFNAFTASVNTTTASFSGRVGSLEAATSSLQNATASLQGATASLFAATASFSGRVGSLESATSSLYSYTSSLNAKTSSFATTGSNVFIGTQTITGSINQSGSFVSTGTITAQTLIIQTITASQEYSSGSNIFGSNLSNTQQFTGSVLITGSLAVNGSNAILTNQTSSMSASYAVSASYASTSTSASFAPSASSAVTASYWSGSINNVLSASYALTASYSANVPVTASYANNANSSSYASTASFATTASYLSGYVSPFPFTGSAIISGSLTVTGSANLPNITGSLQGTASYAVTASNAVTASYLSGYVSPFPFTGSAIISGSLTVTGSLTITGSNTLIGTKTITGSVFISGSKNIIGTNTVTGSMLVSGSTGISGSLTVNSLSGSGVRYLVADESGSITAQSASAALKSTQAFTSTAGQTTFSVTNGYSTGYVDVFINGSKLSTAEFTDTSGTNIVLATGSFSGDTVEVVKYTPAAGVTNNVLRQLTTFTGSAGQTVFSASYTPGLLDIFYNGSRLSPSDYTANNGTFFTLATGSAANDILDVLVYSYQVGAFSGIGGQGVTNQLSFFNTTSSISGSTNLTYNGSTLTLIGTKVITGSVFISGSKTIIGTNTITGSLFVTGSQTFIGTKTITGSVFITGSKTVIGNNTVSGSMSISGSLDVNGTITATTLVVQTVSSSVIYSSGSNVFGNASSNNQTFTGSLLVSGSTHSIFGNVVLGNTSSINASARLEVKGDSFITPIGTTASKLHLYNNDSTNETYIYDSGSSTNSILILSPGGINKALAVSSSGFVGIGTITPTSLLEVQKDQNAQTGIRLRNSTSGTGASVEFGAYTNSGNGGFGKYSTTSTAYKNIVAASTYIYNGSSGDIGLLNDVSTGNISFAAGASSTAQMFISASGNIGIGTLTPIQKLDVVGRGNFSGVDTPYIDFKSTDTTGVGWQFKQISFKDATNAELYAIGYAYPNMKIDVAGSRVMTLTNGGDVGIGTSAPNTRLTIVGGSGAATGYGNLTIKNTSDTGLSFGASGTSYTWIQGNVYGSGTQMIAINPQGSNISIGTTTDFGYKLNLNGQPGANGYTAWTNWSDSRLKENITDLEATNVLNKICAIRPVTYNYNELSGFDEATRSRRISGFIAQELMEVFPDMVGTITKQDTEYYDTNLSNLNLYLVKAIQEQQTLITALQEKLERNNIN
jgi:hypothetical protein